MGCLYRLTSPSNKSYVGITKRSFDDRWKSHIKDSKRGDNLALYNAMQKYGHDAFRCEVLVIANDMDYLCNLERKTISVFGTKSPNGYNLVAGGEGSFDPSEETRTKMRASATARFAQSDERAKASARTKNTWTPEHTARMCVVRKVVANTTEAKAIARKRLEKQRKDDAFVVANKAGISKAMKVMWADPEYRARMTLLRSNPSPESRERRSEGLRKSWAKKPKEFRVGPMLGRKHTVETKMKMSEAAKARRKATNG